MKWVESFLRPFSSTRRHQGYQEVAEVEVIPKFPSFDTELQLIQGDSVEEKEEVKSKFMGSQSKVGQTAMPTHTGPKIRHKGPKISRKELKKREKDMKNPKLIQGVGSHDDTKNYMTEKG